MRSQTLLFAFIGTAIAYPQLQSRATFSGTATFNNYQSQGQTVCGPLSGQPGTWGAAAGDISPDVSGGLCYSNKDFSKCNGQNPVAGYQGPACPKGNCGACYTVTNRGGFGGAHVGGIGNQIKVQIIDSCPSVSAYNYCKTDVPAQERCGAGNSLDIDLGSYQQLTGTPFASGNVPNLNIDISPTSC